MLQNLAEEQTWHTEADKAIIKQNIPNICTEPTQMYPQTSTEHIIIIRRDRAPSYPEQSTYPDSSDRLYQKMGSVEESAPNSRNRILNVWISEPVVSTCAA